MEIQQAVQRFMERIIISYSKNAYGKDFKIITIPEEDGFRFFFGENIEDVRSCHNMQIPYSSALKLFMGDNQSPSAVSYSINFYLDKILSSR